MNARNTLMRFGAVAGLALALTAGGAAPAALAATGGNTSVVVTNDGFGKADSTVFQGNPKENAPVTTWNTGSNGQSMSKGADLGEVVAAVTNGSTLTVTMNRDSASGSDAFIVEVNHLANLSQHQPRRSAGDLRVIVEQHGNTMGDAVASVWKDKAWAPSSAAVGSSTSNGDKTIVVSIPLAGFIESGDAACGQNRGFVNVRSAGSGSLGLQDFVRPMNLGNSDCPTTPVVPVAPAPVVPKPITPAVPVSPKPGTPTVPLAPDATLPSYPLKPVTPTVPVAPDNTLPTVPVKPVTPTKPMAPDTTRPSVIPGGLIPLGPTVDTVSNTTTGDTTSSNPAADGTTTVTADTNPSHVTGLTTTGTSLMILGAALVALISGALVLRSRKHITA
ncbi:MAG: hypothetical protein LBH13_01515 [Cellulomonadaceae bacterium]|jgi:hypothetical protein|nr:hypothetical protein [Cellulomonadaceae bacterium]